MRVDRSVGRDQGWRDVKRRRNVGTQFDIVDIDPAPGFENFNRVRSRFQFDFRRRFDDGENRFVREGNLSSGNAVYRVSAAKQWTVAATVKTMIPLTFICGSNDLFDLILCILVVVYQW